MLLVIIGVLCVIALIGHKFTQGYYADLSYYRYRNIDDNWHYYDR